jgi:hypothetical protein
MLIFGVHRILIGIIDFAMEKKIHINDISYNWFEGILLAIGIELILLPCIILTLRRFPILLGRHF